MTALPASGYLVEFCASNDGADDSAGPISAFVAGGNAIFATHRPTTPTERAYDEGVASGRAAAKADCEARLEEQKAAFEKDLAAARHAWSREQGERLAQQVSASLQGLETKLAEITVRLLSPFLSEQVRQSAIEDLRASLADLLMREPGGAISVSGPEDLLTALRAGLADTSAVTYVVSNTCDVRVTTGQTMIETRLSAWLGRLEEAVR